MLKDGCGCLAPGWLGAQEVVEKLPGILVVDDLAPWPTRLIWIVILAKLPPAGGPQSLGESGPRTNRLPDGAVEATVVPVKVLQGVELPVVLIVVLTTARAVLRIIDPAHRQLGEDGEWSITVQRRDDAVAPPFHLGFGRLFENHSPRTENQSLFESSKHVNLLCSLVFEPKKLIL